jgi:hypothetical protein
MYYKAADGGERRNAFLITIFKGFSLLVNKTQQRQRKERRLVRKNTNDGKGKKMKAVTKLKTHGFNESANMWECA